MCTAVILRRPQHPWPVLVAANRDERRSRPWQPPARHWPDRADVIGGMDDISGGSWLAMNDYGVAALLLNRRGTLGPHPDKRSRGELVLEALDHADAVAAAAALADLNSGAYAAFNLLVADNQDAYWIANDDRPDRPFARVLPIPVGWSMIAADDLNDPASERLVHLNRFRDTDAPDPDADDWSAWQTLLASRDHDPATGPLGAMNVDTDSDYGTVSSSLIALPGADRAAADPVWLFADGPPDRAPFRRVALAETPADDPMRPVH